MIIWSKLGFMILTMTVSGSIWYLLWCLFRRWLDRRGYIKVVYYSLLTIIVFFLFPIVYLSIVAGTVQGDVTVGNVFAMTPPVYQCLKVIGVVWTLGLIREMILFGRDAKILRSLKKRSFEADKTTQEIWRTFQSGHPGTKDIQIGCCYGLEGPMICGLYRMKILFPAEKKYSEEELRCLFTHEWMHRRHMDILIKRLVMWITCIHWFNPLTKQMLQMVNEWSEYYCDEDTVEQLADHRLYYETLKVCAVDDKRKVPWNVSMMVEDKQTVLKRIERMRNIER